MKVFAKIIATMVSVYALLWVAVAVYFSQASNHQSLLQSTLSQLFKRPVSIGSVTTSWNGISPRIHIQDLAVQGDIEGLPALSFKSLAAEMSGVSILGLWPKFTEFAIQQPGLEIVSLSTNQLQIAGIPLKSGSAQGVNPRRLISWLLNHESLVWHDGEVIWRRLDGETQRYSHTSFVYQRDDQKRIVRATSQTPKGVLAFKAETNGEVLEADNWGASLEILGNQGQRILMPQDLSLQVDDGVGQVTLKAMNVSRIRDLLRLSGLGGDNNWLLESQLKGRLHDVMFKFSGPLLELRDWSLQANASQISFNSVSPAPAMNNLHGELYASSKGGEFQFSTADALFDWPRWYSSPFEISNASGGLSWAINDSGMITLSLNHVQLQDRVFNIESLNATVEIDQVSRSVRNFGELFKLESIADLSFEGREIVKPDSATGTLKPLFMDANVKFSMSDMSQVERYLPQDERLSKLRVWWENALIAGQLNNGSVRYQGELSKNAIYVGKAEIHGEAFYSDMEIDFGYLRNWPVAKRGRGRATLENDKLVFEADEVWLDDDQVLEPKLEILQLYKLDRRLELSASLNTSLTNGVKFLFDGPLLKPRDEPRTLPITADQGSVFIETSVSMPLRRVRDTQVSGSARIENGRLWLPPGVPVSNLSATVSFTGESAEASDIQGQFLGHPMSANLLTTEAAQPPKLKLSGQGDLDVSHLQPWVGDHLLSWLNGSASWQAGITIDGSDVTVDAGSNLQGVEISAPAPLNKMRDSERPLSLTLQIAGADQPQALSITSQGLRAEFEGPASNEENSGRGFLQKSRISIGELATQSQTNELQDGVHFEIGDERLSIDDWLSALIQLARLPIDPDVEPNTVFLDAMRTINIDVENAFFLGREFGALGLEGLSVDGGHWIGSLNGENLSGTMQAEPRAEVPSYRFKLARLHLQEDPGPNTAPSPIDSSLVPAEYPSLELDVESFRLGKKGLGHLLLSAAPQGEEWVISKFLMVDHGISTEATGRWVNNPQQGTISKISYQTVIDEAGDVLDEMDFAGMLKKGKGTMSGNVIWIGAPHEFDYARLNGDFDLRIQDGELTKVEPGGGKLLGLLNFNAFARRLTLDFSDLFASGLEFDRIRLAGVLADGEAIMRDAFVFSPAVFIQMEGKLDLNQEMIDMELHMSPELGGNLTLLSALANPAAGAVVFITQQLFKDEMRASSFQSYRALGTWQDFELEEFGRNKPRVSEPSPASLPSNSSK